MPLISPMSLSLIVFLIAYLFIATEKVDKTVAALLGAMTVIGLHLAPYEELLHKVDLNVVFLLVGMMIIVNVLSTTGVFEWVAITIAQKARGNGILILILFVLVTAGISALLDNVTTVILIAPVTILITQLLELPTVPFLIMEAIFSNIGGTATLVGDPPNIVIGSQTSLTFNDFLINLSPIILAMMILFSGILVMLFARRTKVGEDMKKRVALAKPDKAIIRPKVLWRALPVFGLVLLGFFLSRTLNIEPGAVAMTGAFLMLLVCKVHVHEALEKVEWSTILFFIGLFIMIGSLEHNHVFELMGEKIVALTSGKLFLTALVILWASAILSAIVDNIPLVIAMIPVIKSIIPSFSTQMHLTAIQTHAQITAPLFWALALGACLGGNGTLIGASANVVISQIARRNRYRLTFMDFTRYGVPFTFLSLLMSTVYLYLRYFRN